VEAVGAREGGQGIPEGPERNREQEADGDHPEGRGAGIGKPGVVRVGLAVPECRDSEDCRQHQEPPNRAYCHSGSHSASYQASGLPTRAGRRRPDASGGKIEDPVSPGPGSDPRRSGIAAGIRSTGGAAAPHAGIRCSTQQTSPIDDRRSGKPEAARAGEQGKAFAVVAQEIKSLAEQSKQATTQVRTILNDVQKATSAAVMATEQGSKAVEAGVKQSAQAGEAIRVLAESSTEAVQAATQIVASSQQQVVGMNQIGTAMENVNQAGAETAASMKQAETAAKNLHELGQKLKGMVEQFKV